MQLSLGGGTYQENSKTKNPRRKRGFPSSENHGERNLIEGRDGLSYTTREKRKDIGKRNDIREGGEESCKS